MRGGERASAVVMTTLPAAALPAAGRRSRAPAAAAVALGGFAAATIAAAAATPGYSQLEEHISALAARDAPHPWIVTAGLFSLVLALFAMAIALRDRLGGRAVPVLLTVAGILLAGAALAREDCSTAQAACAAREVAGTVSGAHVLHQLVSLLAFVLVIAALFAAARALKRSGRDARPTRAVALACVVLVAVLVTGAADGAEGLVQGVFLLLAFGWPLRLAM